MSWPACQYRHSGVFESYRCCGDLWIKSVQQQHFCLPIESGLVGGSDSPPKRRKDRFQSDPQHLTASVSPGREVVDTAFGALNSCGRTEEVYPPILQDRRHPAEDAGFWGESTTPPAAKPLT